MAICSNGMYIGPQKSMTNDLISIGVHLTLNSNDITNQLVELLLHDMSFLLKGGYKGTTCNSMVVVTVKVVIVGMEDPS